MCKCILYVRGGGNINLDPTNFSCSTASDSRFVWGGHVPLDCLTKVTLASVRRQRAIVMHLFVADML